MAGSALIESLLNWGGPMIMVVGLCALAVWVSLRAIPNRSTTRIYRQLAVITLVLGTNVLLVLVLPLAQETRGQLLSLFGLVLTAIIALSSTTFVSNAMAGLMLRSVGSFHPGDFILVDEHFGRVTEQGLLHTEIQSEDRDLVTLPNLFVISHPVKVVSGSGTLVSCDVSLGYDAPRQAVRDALKAGAASAGLTDPFVQIKALLDHAVAYRVSGFLEDVSALVSKRTELNAGVLDALHGAGIEIVSPSFMNQRRIAPEQPVLPDQPAQPEEATALPVNAEAAPERIMFDKAEMAGRLTGLRQQREEVAAEIKALESAGNGESTEITWRKRQLATLDEVIRTLESD